MKKSIIARGTTAKLGAHLLDKGVNFSLFSAHAEKVEVCFFDENHQETQRIALPFVTKNIWHGVISPVSPGEFYGYRVYGKWQPELGYRFNHHKILLDPYAKKISHLPVLEPLFYGFKKDNNLIPSPDQDLVLDDRDNGRIASKAVICDNLATHQGYNVVIPWSQTVIYELHIKGMSQLCFDIDDSFRGKFTALTHPTLIKKLKKLGVTSIKIMPPQVSISEQGLLDKELTNYWGYNPLNFFIPHPLYANNDERIDFIAMVTTLHNHGIEVLVDLVFNHTAESDHLGPHLSFRGIDNLSYYILDKDNPRFYQDHSGCGNTLKTYHPAVARLIIDALEEWADLGVDGIRFDLGSLLAIDKEQGFDENHPIFFMIEQNPKLNRLKMIAEPWSMNGHHLGSFPTGWAELNDNFRDTIKKSAINQLNSPKDLAHVLAGNDDIFSLNAREDRRPINYIANHDGMNLMDLVSYQNKHNEANGEDNRDGSNNNYSVNYGVEGFSDDELVLANRIKHIKNLLLMLFFSQGVPMIQAGDESGHSRQGNNNPFCQDNQINWLNWVNEEKVGEVDVHQILSPFLAELINWRKSQFAFFSLRQINREFRQIHWYNHHAKELSSTDWNQTKNIKLGMLYLLPATKKGIYCLINLTNHQIEFKLPDLPFEEVNWKLKFNSSLAHIDSQNENLTQTQLEQSIMIWQSW
ncbi:MAG: glycogen debranching protein GlgX [SAR324 cluster bacterium]|nr:glycogen debranching protein GlgX [SAR324 cluster bacterium]